MLQNVCWKCRKPGHNSADCAKTAMYVGNEINVQEQFRRYERSEEVKPEGKIERLAVFAVDGGEGDGVEFDMIPMNPPYSPAEDGPRARRARAKTCGSNRVLGENLLVEDTCGTEKVEQEEVLVMGSMPQDARKKMQKRESSTRRYSTWAARPLWRGGNGYRNSKPNPEESWSGSRRPEYPLPDSQGSKPRVTVQLSCMCEFWEDMGDF